MRQTKGNLHVCLLASVLAASLSRHRITSVNMTYVNISAGFILKLYMLYLLDFQYTHVSLLHLFRMTIEILENRYLHARITEEVGRDKLV